MTNKNLKSLFLIAIISFFVFTLPVKIFAIDLEVAYPTTITGSTITGQSDLSQYLKYIFDFGMSIGLAIAVLNFVIAGILYFVAPLSAGAKEKAKERITGSVSGVLILLLTYLIITTINPYLSIFRMNSLEQVDIPEVNTESFGINFYKSGDCSGTSTSYTTSITDLGDLKNKVNSIKIDQNADGDVYYIAVAYDNTKYWGQCQYINPNTGCQKNNVGISSSSIYTYDFSPNGDGVYLYRKSFSMVSGKEENKDGGYLKITTAEIQNKNGRAMYVRKLSDLKFTGASGSNCTVPQSERDCARWNDTGTCAEYQCPSLDKENISSIKISGNYLVLLVYKSSSDSASGPWTYCQAFPTEDDANKDGPQQIKWDEIRNSGREPNYILIIPVQQK